MARLLEGDRALVTGAGRGIGRAMADALEQEGATVFRADVADADLSKEKECVRLVHEAIQRLGSVSIFVQCASPQRQETKHMMAVSYPEWREMIAVNLDAAFIIAQTLGRHMVDKGVKGRILLTTSLHAESPRNLPHYSASKAGQTMLVKELARALGPHGIRVNAIVPGAIPGEGFKGLPGMEKMIPLGRFGKPADVAAMAVAVHSERFGGYVTGASIVVDGGIALHNWIPPSST
jgi:NAD(P)-dependent dehydrogenase (short-subunit alcohol dehydrogenase family)